MVRRSGMGLSWATAVLLVIATGMATAFAWGAVGFYRVIVNGHEVSNYRGQDGTIYVPLDQVARALGADVIVQGNQMMVTLPRLEPAAPAAGQRGYLRGAEAMRAPLAPAYLLPTPTPAAIAPIGPPLGPDLPPGPDTWMVIGGYWTPVTIGESRCGEFGRTSTNLYIRRGTTGDGAYDRTYAGITDPLPDPGIWASVYLWFPPGHTYVPPGGRPLRQAIHDAASRLRGQ